MKNLIFIILAAVLLNSHIAWSNQDMSEESIQKCTDTLLDNVSRRCELHMGDRTQSCMHLYMNFYRYDRRFTNVKQARLICTAGIRYAQCVLDTAGILDDIGEDYRFSVDEAISDCSGLAQ